MLVLGLMAAGVVAFIVWPGEREPEYKGKKLSEWLRRHRDSVSEQAEAANAVRRIGTNAVPWLLKWMDYSDLPPWKERLFRSAAKYPRIRNSKLFRSALRATESDRNFMAAAYGFEILGADAKEAIPTLSWMLNDSTQGGKGGRAASALGQIGREALPALLSALADESHSNRLWIAYCIGRMKDLGPDADESLPVLIRCMKSTDKALAGVAAKALGKLRPNPDLAIPALREALHDPDLYLRIPAITALGEYAEQARSAVPDLLEVMNDLDIGVRYCATNALNMVEGRPPINQFE